MNILYVANLIPYPLDGGGKIFTYSTIQALSKDNDVELICFYEHEDVQIGEKKLKEYCSSVDTLPIKVTTRENMSLMMVKAVRSLFSDLPLGISKYIIHEMKLLIKKKMEYKKYDCAFFNILAMFGYYEYIKSIDPQIRVVLYEQNCETTIYRRYFEQTNNIVKKAFLKIEVNKLNRFEQKAVRKVECLAVLSEEDRKELGVSTDKCSVIPIGITSCKKKNYDSVCSNKLKMLFVGTMTWVPNSEGIVWFLKNVMPMCADRNRYELSIVGKNPGDEVKILCSKFDNVNLLGYVESLDSVFSECDVLIVPLFIGSGQRVKIIEAFSRGYTVISTSIGAEGLKYQDGKSILIADNADDFKNQIEKCFNHSLLQKIGYEANQIFNKEYSVDIISKKINKMIR